MSDTTSIVRRVYLHCEFLPADPTVRGLVSIGLTDDAGHDYYAVNNGMDLTAVLNLPWMVDNVWPHLPRCTELFSARSIRTVGHSVAQNAPLG